jgi:hypothetical protein
MRQQARFPCYSVPEGVISTRSVPGAIEEFLDVNHPVVQSRRSTRWLESNELARYYHHRSRNVLPRLKNELRL